MISLCWRPFRPEREVGWRLTVPAQLLVMSVRRSSKAPDYHLRTAALRLRTPSPSVSVPSVLSVLSLAPGARLDGRRGLAELRR